MTVHRPRRSRELTALSHDHHRALVLVQKIRSFLRSSETDAMAMWGMVRAAYDADLAPHFATEEQYIAVPLTHHDRHVEAQELYRQHIELREYVMGTHGESHRSLGAFADRLQAHVKFEERELFPLAEQVLTVEELAAVERASRSESADSTKGEEDRNT